MVIVPRLFCYRRLPVMKHSWIRTLFARPVVRPLRKAQVRARPTLEMLEDRWVPSNIVVNNPTDTPIAGQTDLRQAIAQANTNGGDETITFDSTVFATPQTITLGGTHLELTDTTGTETITGPAAGVTVNGNNASRVFQVDGMVTASISGLTISGGSATAGVFDAGGGLLNYGTTTLTNCTVSGNSASFGGGVGTGSVYNPGGTTTLTNCTVSGNSASRIGGGVSMDHGTLTLTNCTVNGNSAGSGGGLFQFRATATLTNCTVSSNSAYLNGGGLASYAGTATLTNCTVSGNSAGS